jgi:pyruvate/2-oxoglutarate dehydrogenase complex dihydrolipoamide dehydrogenase (E3) component
MNHNNMIVIGSDPAGKRTAIQATKLGSCDHEKIIYWPN